MIFLIILCRINIIEGREDSGMQNSSDFGRFFTYFVFSKLKKTEKSVKKRRKSDKNGPKKALAKKTMPSL